MASCEPDSFHRRLSKDFLALPSPKNNSMIPPKSKAGFMLQISANLDHYNPTTAAYSIFDQHETVSYFELFKGSDPVSSRLLGSSDPDCPSLSSISSTLLSDTEKDTHTLQQPVHMSTFGTTQLSYGSLKRDPHCEEGPNSALPSINSNTRGYYTSALTSEQSASNRETLSGYQTTGYEHLGYSETTEHSFHSAPQSGLQRSFSTGLRTSSSTQLPPQQYRQDGRSLVSDIFGEQLETIKIQQQQQQQQQPMKIASGSVQEMPTGSWMYSLAPQMHYDGGAHASTASISIVSPQPHVHVPTQAPALAPGIVHVTLNGQNAPSSENSSTRSHSPGSYTYHNPSPSALHSAHSSIYGGGEVSSSRTSSFNETDATSDSRSPHESSGPYTAPRVALSSSISLEHFSNTYAETRPHHEVQLLHCSQCTQRFASHDHFIKHQIKHQKLHRCRIPGCSRVEGFTTPNDRDRHEKSVHKTPGMYFRCMDESCASYRKTFARRDNLKDHLKRMHKMPSEMDEAEANERRNELADSWRVDLNSGLTPPPSGV